MHSNATDACESRLELHFVTYATHDRKLFRILVILDEFTRACLALVVARSITADDVLEVLAVLMIQRGVPDHIRSANGPEFTAKALRKWLTAVGAKTLYIEPGSP